MTTLRASRLAPWSGIIAAPAAWALHQQGLADMLHFNCRLGGSAMGLLFGVCACAVLVGSGLLSWFSRAAPSGPTQRFIATLGTMAAAVFLFAVLLQTLATLLLPGCGPS